LFVAGVVFGAGIAIVAGELMAGCPLAGDVRGLADQAFVVGALRAFANADSIDQTDSIDQIVGAQPFDGAQISRAVDRIIALLMAGAGLD
jgi:hypothetical protein